MKTLIIIPTYNENQNIAVLLDDILTRIDKTVTDILVVDDNSEDGTAETVKQYMSLHANISLQSRPGKLGLASAYIGVFRKVQNGDLSDKGYEALIMMDADLSHPPEYIPEIIEKLKKYDMVNGSRYIPGGEIRNWPFRRRFLSRFGNIYVRMILQTGIKDMSTGYVGFKISGISNINLLQIKAKGYAFLSEMKYLFKKLNFKICEIPIVFSDRINGDSKLSNSIIKEGLIMPWQIKFKNIKTFMNPVKCNLCGETADFAFNKSGFNLYKCRDCQFIQVHPKVDNKTLENYYSETYFKAENTNVLAYHDYAKSLIFKKDLYNKVLKILRNFDKIKTVLDVGCAYGDFPAFLNNESYDATGIDISEHAIKTGISNGIKVYHGTLEDSEATSNNQKYDAITLLDVFEHVNDPIACLKKVQNLLTDNGIAIIITPNTYSFPHKLFKSFWYLFTLPQHLNYFNTDNIKILTEKQNWKIEQIYSPRKKFSLSYFIHFASVWLHLSFLQRFNFDFFDKIVFTYPFRDNMIIVLQKKENEKK